MTTPIVHVILQFYYVILGNCGFELQFFSCHLGQFLLDAVLYIIRGLPEIPPAECALRGYYRKLPRIIDWVGVGWALQKFFRP